MAAMCLGIKLQCKNIYLFVDLRLPSYMPVFDQLAAYWIDESMTQNFDNNDQEC
jgi:hypothetical protein